MDAALDRCEGRYIAIVPSGFPVKDMWIENPLHALINSPVARQGFEPEGSTDGLWAAVVKKDDLQSARTSFPNLPVRESLKAAGIALRHPAFEEFPFQFDNLLGQARSAQKDGDWSQAAEMYEFIAGHHRNEQWMDRLAARAFFEAGDHTRAAELCREVNSQRPTVDTLLLEAKLKREKNDLDSAIKLLKTAEQILADPLPYLLDRRACPGAGVPRHE
jgi:tetratricopeptide (TPR) repeat protein